MSWMEILAIVSRTFHFFLKFHLYAVTNVSIVGRDAGSEEAEGARPPSPLFSDLPTYLIVHYTNRGSLTSDLYKMILHFPTYTFRRPCEVEHKLKIKIN